MSFLHMFMNLISCSADSLLNSNDKRLIKQTFIFSEMSAVLIAFNTYSYTYKKNRNNCSAPFYG